MLLLSTQHVLSMASIVLMSVCTVWHVKGLWPRSLPRTVLVIYGDIYGVSTVYLRCKHAVPRRAVAKTRHSMVLPVHRQKGFGHCRRRSAPGPREEAEEAEN